MLHFQNQYQEKCYTFHGEMLHFVREKMLHFADLLRFVTYKNPVYVTVTMVVTTCVGKVEL